MAKRTINTEDKLLPKLTRFFFDRPRVTAVLFIALALYGIVSYTTLLKREGFPSINIPFAVITGTYPSQNPEEVDAKVSKPLSDIVLKQDVVSMVQARSAPGFFTLQVQYKEGTDAKAETAAIEKAAKGSNQIPDVARVTYSVPNFGVTGGDAQKIDLAASFYATDDQSITTKQLAAEAQKAASYLNSLHIAGVKKVFVKNPFTAAVDPRTGQEIAVQRSFDRYGERSKGSTSYYNSVLIGIEAVQGEDVIKLDNNVQKALDKLNANQDFNGYRSVISASYAPSIKQNISELQRVLLEGLIAVLVVGSIIIAVRASLITVLSMVSVLTITLGLLYAIGYTLNVITLFSLILGLSLIVDDTIIMVEAIDAARRKQKTASEVVVHASGRVSRAMVAATTTAALSFSPLLFVGGILGTFIRAIPVTIISALLISLLVALIFIPFFARFLLLGKKQMGEKGVTEVAAGFEASIARFIARPMLWAEHSRKRLFSLGILALVIGFVFIGAGGFLSKYVIFNIFPATKDTNALTVSLDFPPNTTIEQAEKIAADADKIAARELGDNFVSASYYNSGSSSSAMQMINIISYEKRSVASPELVKKLQAVYDKQFPEAGVVVGQSDVGPPASDFVVQLDASNRTGAQKAAKDIAAYLKDTTLTRPSGKTAHFKNVTITNASLVDRVDGKQVIRIMAGFDGNDTTTLVTLAKEAVNKQFPPSKIATYGLSKNALSYDLGQESDNQNSFKSLALAFPVLLFVIFILLAIQFRSLLQPLLIFMAIPFSLFGIMLGLYLTDNPISFFAMLGFFALIGLSIKNTILLTDFANQSRRAGAGPVEAAVAALEERFRPLIATSITAVVSLIPLAVTSPFWQGLAVVLIFGLISSTLLVVTVFPYYYLGAEFLRSRISRTAGLTGVIVSIVLAVALGSVLPALAGTLLGIVIGVGATLIWRRSLRARRTA